MELLDIAKLALLNFRRKTISKKALEALCKIYNPGTTVVICDVTLEDDWSSYDFLQWTLEEGFKEIF